MSMAKVLAEPIGLSTTSGNLVEAVLPAVGASRPNSRVSRASPRLLLDPPFPAIDEEPSRQLPELFRAMSPATGP
jgi:hypothetical protein